MSKYADTLKLTPWSCTHIQEEEQVVEEFYRLDTPGFNLCVIAVKNKSNGKLLYVKDKGDARTVI